MLAVILQPGYLPWLGAFDQLAQADVFVFLDDVTFQRGGVGRDSGWDNRNQIKTANGSQWLTVPCLKTHGPEKPLLKDVAIADGDHGRNGAGWAMRHVDLIGDAYGEAPFVSDARSIIGHAAVGYQNLCALNIDLFLAVASYLGISPEHGYARASTLDVPGRSTERVVGICKAVGADAHLNGPAALNYVDHAVYNAAGVELRIHDYKHPVYPQLHGDFLSHMSILDLIANEGPRSLEVLTNGRQT